VRLYRLDYFSYGLDEILQGYFIQGDWKSFWASLKFDAVHPPLDYLIARGVELFAPADWVRKLPAVFWGTATIPVLGVLIGRRAGKTAGLFTAALLAAAPFQVRYSQEFRPYALGVFLLCLSLLSLDLFLEHPGILRLLALYLACLATAYSLYLAAVVLGLAAAAMLIEDAVASDPSRRRSARRFLAWSPLFLLLLFLAYLPWLPVVIEGARRPAMAPRPSLAPARIVRILSFFTFTAADGREPGPSDAFLLLLSAVGAWFAARSPRTRFLVVWSLGGFAAVETLGQLHPHFDTPNHYLPVGAAIPPLAAVALCELRRRLNCLVIPAAVLALILALDVRFLAMYFQDGRADWRPLARFLRSRPKQERIFTENQYSELCVAFYVEGPEWAYRRGRLGRDVWNLDGEIVRLTWSWRPGETAWLVLAGEPRHDSLRDWARTFSSQPFPGAEGAILYRLDPALRDRVFPPTR
jgi:4-amino-4-deoxy-L-arabinose transferase-like glycosyltransferase